MFPGDPETLKRRQEAQDMREELMKISMQERADELRQTVGMDYAGHAVGTERSRAMQHLVREHSKKQIHQQALNARSQAQEVFLQ